VRDDGATATRLLLPYAQLPLVRRREEDLGAAPFLRCRSRARGPARRRGPPRGACPYVTFVLPGSGGLGARTGAVAGAGRVAEWRGEACVLAVADAVRLGRSLSTTLLVRFLLALFLLALFLFAGII
jgi:hypothetical protein